MKTLQDLETELNAQECEHEIQSHGDGYYLVSVTYYGAFGISSGYNIRSFSANTSYNDSSFIALTIKF